MNLMFFCLGKPREDHLERKDTMKKVEEERTSVRTFLLEDIMTEVVKDIENCHYLPDVILGTVDRLNQTLRGRIFFTKVLNYLKTDFQKLNPSHDQLYTDLVK